MARNATTPLDELMVKSAESLPPVIEKVNEAPASTSLAAYVTTVVMFSAWLMVFVAADELFVMVGASFTLVIVTVNSCVLTLEPRSVAVIVTIYVLFVPTSAGASKFLEVMVRTPPEVIEKNEESVPDTDQVTDSSAVNVCTAVEFS